MPKEQGHPSGWSLAGLGHPTESTDRLDPSSSAHRHHRVVEEVRFDFVSNAKKPIKVHRCRAHSSVDLAVVQGGHRAAAQSGRRPHRSPRPPAPRRAIQSVGPRTVRVGAPRSRRCGPSRRSPSRGSRGWRSLARTGRSARRGSRGTRAPHRPSLGACRRADRPHDVEVRLEGLGVVEALQQARRASGRGPRRASPDPPSPRRCARSGAARSPSRPRSPRTARGARPWDRRSVRTPARRARRPLRDRRSRRRGPPRGPQRWPGSRSSAGGTSRPRCESRAAPRRSPAPRGAARSPDARGRRRPERAGGRRDAAP